MSKLYYTAPSEQVFQDLKLAVLSVWNSKSNDGGYRDEKIAKIKEIENIRDNFMTLLGMFDIQNQRQAIEKCSEATKQEIAVRLFDVCNHVH